jgi:YD repeat-containing protein
MKYNLIIKVLFISLFLFSCHSNYKEKQTQLSFQNKQQLKIKTNRIKSISIFEYGYKFGKLNEKGGLFSIINYDTNGCEIERDEYIGKNGIPGVKYFHSYDSTGRRISTIDEIYSNNNEPYTKTIYRYDSLGNISESVDYYMNGNVAWKYSYHYNGKGLLTEITEDNKLEYEFKYDSTDQLIESTDHTSFYYNKYLTIWHYKYKDNKVIEALRYDENNEPYTLRKYEYKYY